MNEATLFRQLADLLVRHRAREKADPLLRPHEPDALARLLELERPAKGDWRQILAWLEAYLEHSVKTGHPGFLNRMWSGANLPSILAEMVVAVSNTSACTYEAAPVSTLMERYMLETMLELVGFDEGEGQMTSGSSQGNLVAMLAARNERLQTAKEEGLWRQPPLYAFVSAEAHYSLDKAANVLGIGTDHLRKVAVDRRGRMDPDALADELERCRRDGGRPFFVCATLGTTVRGAYDPLEPLAALREEYGFWLHGDGAWGGAALLDDRLRRRFLTGVERLDSFTWDFHKMPGTNLTCNMLLFNGRRDGFRCACSAGEHSYLFREESDTHPLDLGVGSLQCARRVDSLKWFLDWKYFGKKGLARRVRRYLELAEYAERRVGEMAELEMVAPRESFNVCFRYRAARKNDCNDLNLRLRHRLLRQGAALVGVGWIGEKLALRLLITHPDFDETAVDRFLEQVAAAGRELDRLSPDREA